jgi:hypothetical protein
MEDQNWNNATGRLCGWIMNPAKKSECEEARDERKTGKLDAKSGNTESDKIIAQAILEKQRRPAEVGMSPMAITGIIVGSLMAITIMVVIIKKVKARRG